MRCLPSKLHALSTSSALLALAILACQLAAVSSPMPEPTEAPTKFARAVILDSPVATPPATPPAALTAITQALVSTPTATTAIRSVQPTANAPSGTATAAPSTRTRTLTLVPTLASGGCPTVAIAAPKPSGIVKSMIIGTRNSSDALVIPTTTFQTTTIVHAIVGLTNANKTRVKTAWYANDVGKAAPCNKLVDSAELADLSGSPYVDFTLDPPHLVGNYRVEVYVNGNLDQVASFTVK